MVGPDAFWSGVAAGLGVALPLGAIGILIVREGVERGIRPAAAAATAVACVDLGYATLAVVVGERVATALAGSEQALQLVAAIALLAVAAHGLVGLRRPPAASRELPTGAVFVRFVALTAVNPLTAVYFVALTTGLSAHLTGAGQGAAFALGVFAGSWAWQLVLAALGSAAGARMSERFRIGVSVLGYLIVLGYGVRLVLS